MRICYLDRIGIFVIVRQASYTFLVTKREILIDTCRLFFQSEVSRLAFLSKDTSERLTIASRVMCKGITTLNLISAIK